MKLLEFDNILTTYRRFPFRALTVKLSNSLKDTASFGWMSWGLDSRTAILKTSCFRCNGPLSGDIIQLSLNHFSSQGTVFIAVLLSRPSKENCPSSVKCFVLNPFLLIFCFQVAVWHSVSCIYRLPLLGKAEPFMQTRQRGSISHKLLSPSCSGGEESFWPSSAS